MNDRGPGWYIERYRTCWWIVLGLYVWGAAVTAILVLVIKYG